VSKDLPKGDEQAARKQGAKEAAGPTHDDITERAVEARVHGMARKTIANEDPARAAERMVQVAESELIHQEMEVAEAEREDREEREHPAPPERTLDSLIERGQRLADGLAHVAEQRIEALPAPVKRVVHTAERAAGMAFSAARAGLYLAGEIVRTPIALVRILLRSRAA
jgi:hypothetical protein